MKLVKYLSIAALFFITGIVSISCSERPLTSEIILDKSIGYHDPQATWNTLSTHMFFDESRPDGTIRKTQIWLDNSKGFFKLNRNDEEVHGVRLDSCFIEKGDVACDRVKTMRGYYLYLWGLPMKLKDPGTQLLDEFSETTWEGHEVYRITADYEEDDWNFYFTKDEFRLVGYEFTQTTGNIEKITLEEETEFSGMKIPASRSWYAVSKGNTFLGTDRLTLMEEWSMNQ